MARYSDIPEHIRSNEPDYVVVRRGLDVPAEWSIGDLEGKWFDRSQLPVVSAEAAREGARRFREQGGAISGAQAVPTGRLEVREDGAVAEVFELWPRFD